MHDKPIGSIFEHIMQHRTRKDRYLPLQEKKEQRLIFDAKQLPCENCDLEYTILTSTKNHKNLRKAGKEGFQATGLQQLLLDRNYSPKLVSCSIARAGAIPRLAALRKSTRKEASKGPIFAFQFYPRLPSIQTLQDKHWRAMTKNNQYLATVFPRPPLTAYRRQTNIRNVVIRAKLQFSYPHHPSSTQKENQRGCLSVEKGAQHALILKKSKLMENWNGKFTRKFHVTIITCFT